MFLCYYKSNNYEIKFNTGMLEGNGISINAAGNLILFKNISLIINMDFNIFSRKSKHLEENNVIYTTHMFHSDT